MTFGRFGFGFGFTGGKGVRRDPAIGVFSSGEQGFYYNFSILSSLFQDTAGTTPVTAATQPIGLVKDQSGRGNDATQSSVARPIWQADGSGLLDGTDDYLISAVVPALAMSLAFKANLTAANGFWGSNVTPNRCYIGIKSNNFIGAAIGAVTEASLTVGPGFLSQTVTCVITTDGVNDILYVNGTPIAPQVISGTPVNARPIFIGAVNSAGTPGSFMKGSFYKALAIARSLTPTEVASISSYWSAH